MKFRKRTTSVATHMLLIILSIFCLFPFYVVVTNSFKSYQEIFENIFGLPRAFTLDNYISAAEFLDFAKLFRNSIIITVGSILGLVIISSMIAFRLVRVPNRFHNILYYVFVAAMIVPFPAVMIPMMKVMTTLGWNNTLYGLIFCYYGFGVSMAVFLYHGFLKGIPRSVEEAAIVDGCSQIKLYVKIVLPLMKPITATLVILDSLWFWNDYLLPLLMLSKNKLLTVPLGINFLFDQFNSKWDLAMASITLAIVPVLILFFIFQKHIIAGVAAGAVKG